MVKKESVSVNWQSLFAIIPIVDLWAAYRIERLRRLLLYFAVIATAIYLAIVLPFFLDDLMSSSMNQSYEYNAFNIGFELASMGTAIIFIRKWSREWNEKISANTST